MKRKVGINIPENIPRNRIFFHGFRMGFMLKIN
jgi:hypothetical protein